jgi:aspartate kinase
MEEPIVSGIATDKGQAKITVIGIPDIPGKAAEVFRVVAEADSNIDMIVQNNPTGVDVTDRVADISFTLPLGDLGRVAGALEGAKEALAFASSSKTPTSASFRWLAPACAPTRASHRSFSLRWLRPALTSR